MCFARKVSTPHYETPAEPKAAPTPTPVQSADVEAEKSAGKQEEKKKTKTAYSKDRWQPTLLGSTLTNDSNKTLG